jgi:hypothetical protein
MVGWGPTVANVAIRRLNARERDLLGELPGPSHCTVLLAEFVSADSRGGCSDGTVLPGHPKACVQRKRTWVCEINPRGAYYCPIRHEPMYMPLASTNATIDGRGALRLDAPPAGTHQTPPLQWQLRYTHIDGYIHRWTSSGTLRAGLTFDQAGGARHYRGHCWRGSEITFDRSALRCFSDVQLDPCFAGPAGWSRPGALVACASVGWTSFGRFVIVHGSLRR